MTPQGQVPQAAPQQGWFQKNWKWLVLGVLVASMMCCGFGTLATVWLGAEVAKDPEVQKAIDEAVKEAERQQKGGKVKGEDKPVVRVAEADKARVDCGAPGPGGVDCDIKRTGGESALQACWDLDITCENGGVMTGHACGELGAAAEKTSVNMPVDAFENQEACDAPASGKVKNLEVEVR